MLPVLKVRADGITDKGDYRPWSWSLGVPPPGPAHSGAAGAKYDKM